MIAVEQMMAATRGIPAHHAMAELNRFTPGIDWVGCSKRSTFSELINGTYGPPMTTEAAQGYIDRMQRLREIATELGSDWTFARRELRRRERLQ